ncbi:MAG: Rab family GTPase [Candidatus Hodarchaeota archaeon]
MYKFKVIVAGDKNVGKSSLITRFCDNVFYEDLKETIGVGFKRKKVVIKEDSTEIALELNIWDFAGEEKYRKLFPAYAYGASAALFLFDITNIKSLYDIDNWIKVVEENASNDVVKINIATKIDLKDEREVSKEEAIEFFEKYTPGKKIIETSSKTGENVEKAFIYVAKELIDKSLQKCKACGVFFSKKLNYCQYCGERIESERI